jgi:hypothetical protein
VTDFGRKPLSQNQTAQLWANLWEVVMSDLTRFTNAPKFDDLDHAGYAAALTPLCQWLAARGMGHNAAQVHQVRYAIRNCEFRPTYEKVEGFVNKAIGRVVQELTGAEIEARQLQSMPANPPAALLEAVPGEWKESSAPLPGVQLDPDPRFWRSEQFPSARAHFLALKRALNRTTDEARLKTLRAESERGTYRIAPGVADPLDEIPADMRAEYMMRALNELKAKGRGRSPMAQRDKALSLYRLAMSEQRQKQQEEAMMAGYV